VGCVTCMVTAVGPRRSTFAVDLARDPMTWPGASTSLGPALSPRELAANQVLALRAVAALADHLPLEDMLADAEAKEPAFSRRLLAEWVRKVIASPQADWPEG